MDIAPSSGDPPGFSRSADFDNSGTLASAALSRIIALMRAGALRPGGIVNEADLAKRFGMSRGPVREAVRQLEGRKLVVRAPYQRARVVELDLARIQEIYELREALEGMACRLAARRMTDAELAALMRAVELAKGPENYSFIDTDYPFNFHEAVVEGSGNGKIKQVLGTDLYDLIRLYRWSANIHATHRGAPSHDHLGICRAMVARDEDRAETLMRAHIQRALSLIRAG